ncbi:hypothetical protein [Streptomyces sp. NRRL F-2580]|uniref:hypothetical protein n=1 Tax=Streptomyces sp. NRRL F-2580 TaxID=1463841 RepID=UPI00131AA986|nr:hypothetical protein [Streptomyces sp. NRRL F-2580]
MKNRFVRVPSMLRECNPPRRGRAQQAAQYPNTDAGFRKLIIAARFDKDVVASPEPNAADYAAVFEPGLRGQSREDVQERIWPKPPAALDVDPEKTEIKVATATADAIRDWLNEVSEGFPGGYERVAPYLKPGTTIYRCKYLEPG